MNYILTKQMIRDVLMIKGPCSVSDIMLIMNLPEDARSRVLLLLNDLSEDLDARLNVLTQTWSSDTKFTC